MRRTWNTVLLESVFYIVASPNVDRLFMLVKNIYTLGRFSLAGYEKVGIPSTPEGV